MNSIKKNLRDVAVDVDRKIVFQQFKRQNNTAIVNHRPVTDWKGREEPADTMLHPEEANDWLRSKKGQVVITQCAILWTYLPMKIAAFLGFACVMV